MAILIQGQRISLATGQRSVGPIAVPDALETLALVTMKYTTVADPSLWANPATIIRAVVFMSLDGGATWRQISTFSTNGGPHIVKGVEVPETTWGFVPLHGPNRQMRLDYEVENGPLVTDVDVVVV